MMLRGSEKREGFGWAGALAVGVLLLAGWSGQPAGAAGADAAETGAGEAAAAAAFAGPVEEAHGMNAWKAQEAVSADVTVTFGGREALSGHLVFKTDMSASRLELIDGTVAVYDGTDAWVAPQAADFQGARFHLLTWPYFLSLPYKLRDPGTHLSDFGERELQGKVYETARLSFEAGVGDTPDDWYVVYREPETGLVRAMAYIVTYGTSRAAAEAEPHAITYDDFVDVEGARVATSWTFWHWGEEEGIHNDPIGTAEIANLRFLSPEPGTFEPPAGARKAEMPR